MFQVCLYKERETNDATERKEFQHACVKALTNLVSRFATLLCSLGAHTQADMYDSNRISITQTLGMCSYYVAK